MISGERVRCTVQTIHSFFTNFIVTSIIEVFLAFFCTHTNTHMLLFCSGSRNHFIWSCNSSYKLIKCVAYHKQLNDAWLNVWAVKLSGSFIQSLRIHGYTKYKVVQQWPKNFRNINVACHVVCRLHATIANTTWNHSQFSISFSVCTSHVIVQNVSSHSTFPNHCQSDYYYYRATNEIQLK